MKTVLEVVQLATGYLDGRRLAEEAIAHALGVKRLDLYLQFNKPLAEEELTQCRSVLKRVAAGEPIAQIRGSVEFYGLELKVTPDVLVPRPETELLVERVIKGIDGEGVLWDIGCGSGCIGLAIKKAIPSLRVVMSDICPKALAVAAENAETNEVEVEFRQGDLLEPFAGEQANYVVANPPYVTEAEWEGLTRSVREYEPRGALVGGHTGLEIYERLARDLPTHLETNSKVWFELGAGQGNRLIEFFSNPPWSHAQVDSDWAGHDRFFTVELEPLSALS